MTQEQEPKSLYDEFIEEIINTRGRWSMPPGVLYEMHHIIPVSMGGLPERKDMRKAMRHPNIIWLYPREHLRAHKFLHYKYPRNAKLWSAYYLMSHKDGEELTEDEYEAMKYENHILMLQKFKYQIWDLTYNRIFANAQEAADFYEFDRDDIVMSIRNRETIGAIKFQFVPELLDDGEEK